jgi:hypothetical protein
MANPTTNYGFVLPTPTDLVTDLPADFDVALQGVDTRLKALQPGTTLGDLAYSSATANTNTRLGIGTAGQVLAVSGGVPAWTTTADVTPLTTKGDLFTFTTVDARLGVGTNGQTLVADSAEATGLKWATPAAGGKVLQVVMGTTSTERANSTTTYSDSNLTATITPTLATSKVLVLVNQAGIYIGPGSALNGLIIKLVRAATDLHLFGYRNSGNDDAIQRFGDTVSTAYLDTPATTSATAYKTQIRNYNNAAEVRVQVDNIPMSTIILMEIGA